MSEATSKHTIVPKCEDCGREMKPLWTSYFCPNDCDQKPDVDDGWDPEDTRPFSFSFCANKLWGLGVGVRTHLLDSEFYLVKLHPWFQCVSTQNTKVLTFVLNSGGVAKYYDVKDTMVGVLVGRIA